MSILYILYIGFQRLSTFRLPDLKVRVCSGLTLSGALHPGLKAGAWRRGIGQQRKDYGPNCAKKTQHFLQQCCLTTAFYITPAVSYFITFPLMMGEGKDGGGRLGPSPPTPESSPTVGGRAGFLAQLRYDNKPMTQRLLQGGWSRH